MVTGRLIELQKSYNGLLALPDVGLSLIVFNRTAVFRVPLVVPDNSCQEMSNEQNIQNTGCQLYTFMEIMALP
jgi:hypothetical protein